MNKLMLPAEFREKNTGAEGVDKERLAEKMRVLEAWYTGELERRLKDITEVMQAELQGQIEHLEARYKERCKGTQPMSASLEPQGQTSPKALLEAKGPPASKDLTNEVAKIEATLVDSAAQLERMMSDDSAALGQLLQIRSQELELKAYLRGLKFTSGVR